MSTQALPVLRKIEFEKTQSWKCSVSGGSHSGNGNAHSTLAPTWKPIVPR